MRKHAAWMAFAAALGLSSPCAALGTLTTLYSFAGSPDGMGPLANIVVDRAGHIISGTERGGQDNGGAIFEISPPAAGQTTWTETVLRSFGGPESRGGLYPVGLIRDRHGNLYGATNNGGSNGCGAVFEMHKTASGFESRTLYQFQGGAQDGCALPAAPTFGPDGALYGDTPGGGAHNYGVVFKLSPPAAGGAAWTETVIWNFNSLEVPQTQMLVDAAGNLYGASAYASPDGNVGAGSVWRLSPPATAGGAGTRTVLWQFSGPDGSNPRGPLVADASGALYGTCGQGGAYGHGVVFKLAPPASGGGAWTESTLFSFSGGAAGAGPTNGVTRASHGELIVPTSDQNGAIIELRPPGLLGARWTERVLWRFSGADGLQPESPAVLLPGGLIVGTTIGGGASGHGTVWELAW